MPQAALSGPYEKFKHYIDCINKHDIDGIMATLADNCEIARLGFIDKRTAAEMRKMYESDWKDTKHSKGNILVTMVQPVEQEEIEPAMPDAAAGQNDVYSGVSARLSYERTGERVSVTYVFRNSDLKLVRIIYE